MKRTLTVLAVVLALTLSAGVAYATMYHFSLLELVEQADFILTGKVGKVGETTAVVDVKEQLKGTISEKQITVTEIYRHHCRGRSKSFSEGEDVLLFLGALKDGKYPVICGGQGKMAIHDMEYTNPRDKHRVTVAEYLEAVKRLIEVSNIKDGEEKTVNFLKMCESSNFIVRHAIGRYLTFRISGEVKLENYKKQVIALLKSKHAETRATGAALLWQYKDSETLACLHKAAGDSEFEVATTAFHSLSRRDSAEAMKALVKMGGNKDVRVRIFACNQLDWNKDPNAGKACADLLDHEDEKVRIQAARSLYRVRNKAWKEVVYPKLVKMLKSSSGELQAAACNGLASCGKHEVLKPLIDMFARKGISKQMQCNILRAIYSVLCSDFQRNKYFVENPEITQYLYNHLHLIIDHLEKEGPGAASAVNILRRVGTSEAIDALEKTARNHPDKALRHLAKTRLDLKGESIADACSGCSIGGNAGAISFAPLFLLLLLLTILRMSRIILSPS